MGYLNLNYRVFWSLFSSGFHIVQQTYQCFVTAHICIWVLGYWAILFLYNIVFVPSSFRLLYCPVNLPIFLLPNASYIFDHTTSYLLTPGLWSFFVTAHAMYLRAKKWATLFFSHLVFPLLLFRLQMFVTAHVLYLRAKHQLATLSYFGLVVCDNICAFYSSANIHFQPDSGPGWRNRHFEMWIRVQAFIM